jgi:hypothetical protein
MKLIYFYLRNCGFILGKVALLSQFRRTENNIEPNINFNELPVMPVEKPGIYKWWDTRSFF